MGSTRSSPPRPSRTSGARPDAASSLWVGIPLLVVLVGIVTWWLVGRALRPVERMRQEVEEISHTTLYRRVDEPATDDEVARLAHTMNDMLDRLEAAAAPAPVRVRRLARAAQPAGDHPHDRGGGQPASRQRGLAGRGHTVLSESERLDELVADLLALAKLDETGNGGCAPPDGGRPRRPRAHRRGPPALTRSRRARRRRVGGEGRTATGPARPARPQPPRQRRPPRPAS